MNAVLLGGNGYIGRNFTKKWLNIDQNIKIYVLSRSGNNKLNNPRIINIKVDVNNSSDVLEVLPEKVDYVVDFVGSLGDKNISVEDANIKPAKTMLKIVENRDVKIMGYVGGTLGSKDFVKTKSKVINMLNESDTKLALVEPTLVYGDGRSDKLSKMVPIFKFLGIFSSKMKPVSVDSVSEELLNKLIK